MRVGAIPGSKPGMAFRLRSAKPMLAVDHVGGRTFIVGMRGRLDFAQAVALERVVERLIRQEARELVLDLTGVTVIDTSGSLALCDAEAALGDAGVDVCVALPSHSVNGTDLPADHPSWRVALDRAGALEVLLRPPVLVG